jgi:uncharacterized protein (TIGR02270 family)
VAIAMIEAVVAQHAEDLAILWNIRRQLVGAGDVALRHLDRLDRRIAAHQDGCIVAGSDGVALLRERLSDAGPGQLFALSVVALEMGDRDALETCFAVAESVPESALGLVSALGWVGRDRLVRVGSELLGSRSPGRRRLGLAACRLHRVDPGAILTAGFGDDDRAVRAEAWRTAGELGLGELPGGRNDDDPLAEVTCRRAFALVLRGERSRALRDLASLGREASPLWHVALELALQAMAVGDAHELLQQMAASGAADRLIWGSGIAGDPRYVPWLIGKTADDVTARLAGEAFTLITGADLAAHDLERRPPENVPGPSDDPDDVNVAMDADEGLPWPDPERVRRWWDANQARFPAGTSFFLGEPVGRSHCIAVLKNGYQRQRRLAARYLCLLEPGTPLFNTSAPAWCQQRLLAQMS